MKEILLLLMLRALTTHGYCAHKSVVPLRDVDLIAKSSNRFGFDFLREISQNQNAFISPISISMLMGMVYSGSKNYTADEIIKVMQFPESVNHGFKEVLDIIKPSEGLKISRSDYILEMANAMLVDQKFNILPTYKKESRKFYDSAVESVSFALHPEAAIESVNGWIAWKTKNKISKILDEPFEPLTMLFLMNAVYFKGTWKTKFDQRFTTPDTFYNNGLVPKTVPMMRQKKKFLYGFDANIQAHVLELPYNGDDITMLFLLPKKRDGLPEMESLLTNAMLNAIPCNLREVSVQVTLPRFNLEEDYDLIPVLKKMGISSVFDSGKSNLRGISLTPGLYVTKAVHKCVVEINEEGSEAATVTGVSAGVRTGGPLVPVFTADHPFMFFIRDSRINLTLFIGRVTKL